MAIYHCSFKIISRGSGRSAVGAAAYRSATKLTNDYDGITHDYTHKENVVHSEIMLCENAPKEYQDRAVLWNEVEKVENTPTRVVKKLNKRTGEMEEKVVGAQLARECEFALPIELSREEQIQLAREFIYENFVKKGMCADWNIHDNEDNPHVHVLLTMRPINADGSWGKKQEKLYLCKNEKR